MTFFYTEISKLAFLFIFCISLALIIILLSFLFSNSNPDLQKVSAYECGFDPYEDARNVFDVRFYLVAIFFIVFDLEAVFFFPWTVSYDLLNSDGVWIILDFIVELLAGFLYAWKVGALDWN